MYPRAGQQAWTPPPNFAMVWTGIYRSAYPTLASVPYLRDIGIKTVVLLSIECLPGPVARALASTERSKRPAEAVEDSRAWKGDANTPASIRVVCTADLAGWMCEYPQSMGDFAVADVQHALDFALQTDFQPVLFTCPTGEVQTSVVVGCMRRYQGWTLTAVFAECESFVNVSHGVRHSIMTFIERWDPDEHPVQESGIVSRMRGLLLRERQHDQHQRRCEGLLHAEMDRDTESEANMMRRLEAAGESGANALLSTLSPVTVTLAPWYTAAKARRAAFVGEVLLARKKAWDSERDRPPHPHERYFGVLNPPALSDRSTFAKESVVEEDDD